MRKKTPYKDPSIRNYKKKPFPLSDPGTSIRNYKKKPFPLSDPGNDPISILIMKNVNKYFNKHPKGKGLWYPEDYFKNLKRKGINLSPEEKQNRYDGYANPDFLEKIGPFTFIAKEGVLPSEALMAFLEGPTVADCGNATLAIYYKTFLDLYGPDEFDKLYDGNFVIKFIMDNPVDREVFKDLGADYIDPNSGSGGNNRSSEDSPEDRSEDIPKRTFANNVGELGNRLITPGEHLHFGCVKWYANKHPAGFGGGWNVIYGGRNSKGEQLFYAHGFDKPLTEKEINNLCVKDYNIKRTKTDLRYIEDDDNPDLYEKKRNKWLSDYYKIDKAEMERNPEKFLEGFLPHTRVFL